MLTKINCSANKTFQSLSCECKYDDTAEQMRAGHKNLRLKKKKEFYTVQQYVQLAV